MAQILVRDLDPETVKQLKLRAQRNRRSLQAEVRLLLEEIADRERQFEDFVRHADWIREQNGPQTSDSTDLIREDRER